MRFDRLLIHRCTLVKHGQVTGQDPYGRDIIEDVPIENVPCRLDQLQKRVSTDERGTDFITENVLFLSASQQVEPSMKVHSIKDLRGNDVVPGIFGIQNIKPIYGRIRLHHYEVTLQKEGESSGEAGLDVSSEDGQESS